MKRVKLLLLGMVLFLISHISFANVAMQNMGKQLILSNSELSITFEKSSARIIDLKKNGSSLMAPGQTGYFAIKGAKQGKKSSTLKPYNSKFYVHLENSEIIDIYFIPPNKNNFPFDIEIHYVLRKAESGFYYYLVVKKPANTADAKINQLKFALRLNNELNNVRLSDQRFGVLPSAEAIKNSDVKNDSCFLTNGEVPVYGLHNVAKNNINTEKVTQGVWTIRGDNIHFNQELNKQRPIAHMTDRGPIMLGHLNYSNDRSRDSYIANQAKLWKKIFGPTFVYINQANSTEEIWNDAKTQARIKHKSWPYSWLKQPLSSMVFNN